MAERNLAVVSENSALATDNMFSDARVQMIRDQIARDAPPAQFEAMIDIAKRRNLDPLSKQISLIKFGNTWTIITTIDGYRAIAEQTGQYAGSDAPVFTFTGNKTQAGKAEPDTCTVTVHKLINGQTYPFSAMVYFEEYSTGRNNWSTMPRTMIAKVAESHALRKAFPAVMSGMYEESEMDQAIEGTARVVSSSNQPNPPDRENEIRRLHAIAGKHGLNHEDLHRWANDREKESLKDMSTASIITMAKKIDNETQSALQYFDSLRNTDVPEEPETVEGQYQEVDPDTGEIIPDNLGQGEIIDMPMSHPNHGDS